MTDKKIRFDAVAMEKLISKDRYLSFVFQDLNKRGHTNKEELLEILFNSNVLEDSIYESLYIKELNNIN